MPARRVIAYGAAVRGGARQFVRHGTLDMDRLAADLAVSRATLYRVAGCRDRLLGDVLWALGSRLLATARAGRTRSGPDGAIEVSRRFVDGLAGAEPLGRFLAGEPQTAVRVLFTPAGRVHERAVAAQQRIFAETGAVHPGADACSVAFLYVRIIESVLYADLLDGGLLGDGRPDLGAAEGALRALLGGRG